MSPDDFIIESLPADVLATMEIRDQWVKRLPRSSGGLEFVVDDLQRWRPGQTVRVAFLSGNVELHKGIAEATREITDACNLKLDFGWNEATGSYRMWKETDTAYTAEIRVSFDQSGYFSLVGTDSIDEGIGAPNSPVGGRPGQRSLNLGGFPMRRPPSWKGTVRHEFLHALAFHHEHQNMRGPCEQSFRWEDDSGYEPTRDSNGTYVKDSAGRRPGIYTYLAGAPNYWPKTKVDHNLRTNPNAQLHAGTFDPKSVMLYRFPEIFYRTLPSPCAPDGDGISLSEGDKAGLRLLYPSGGPAALDIVERKNLMLELAAPALADAMMGAETAVPDRPEMSRRAAGILRATTR